MDDLVQKAQIFLDILTAARGKGAAGWSMEDLERAYGWARYFEQAYARIRSKPQIADRLDRRLKVLASTEASPLGHQQFSPQLLGDAEQFVDQALLQNSYLPPMLYSVVLRRCGQNLGSQNQLMKDAVAFSQLQSAVQLIGHMRELLHRDHSELFHSGPEVSDCCQGRGIQVQTDASLLLQFLRLHVVESAPTQRTRTSIGKKLQEIVVQQQGWETVLTALVLNVGTHGTTSDGPSIDGESNPICRFLLQWVLQTEHNRIVFQVPSSLLVKVAAVYFSFYKTYLSCLVEWGKDMVVTGHTQQDRTWRHRTGDDHYSFEELLSHVLSLLKGPLHVATATLKTLQSLPAPATSPLNRTIWEEILQTPEIISIIQEKNLQE
ncbi:Hypp3736 [Branchiostoma lanceolatum]|uniref:Hypp3736 protein n=1 Tax=Branchiostoma lanceolatum TaxID=7740 RepID=A0A8K0A1U5_BRALA|nr:Hypp3736 [Branchiostoma lanceolatum]